MLRRFPLLACFLTLAACGEPARRAQATEVDPAVAKAIMAPILADPDLVTLDRRFAIMSDPGPLDASLPPDDFAAATIAQARAEARQMTAGAAAPVLADSGACRDCDAAFVDGRAAALGFDCEGGPKPGLEWSLTLPEALPVYPKSHLREAAGSDGPGCSVSAASFTAPVPAREVLAFYRTIAAAEGYALAPAGSRAFFGRKGEARMAVAARSVAGGYSHFDLIATR